MEKRTLFQVNKFENRFIDNHQNYCAILYLCVAVFVVMLALLPKIVLADKG